MRVPLIDLKAEHDAMRSDLDRALLVVINEGNFIGGDRVRLFEEAMADNYDVAHCIGVASGHDALLISLRMLGIGPGDEVITTAYSWIATANAISQTGAQPVFVDIEENGFNIDPEQVIAKITEKTRALLPVHLYGAICEMGALGDIARDRDLIIVEDAAQAHGAIRDGKRPGQFGHAATFSFYPTKQLGAWGDAGCILTDDPEMAAEVRRFANHGMMKKGVFKGIGINSRMDAIQAAVLKAKLSYLDKWVRRRQEIAGIYERELQGVNVQVPFPGTNSVGVSFYNYPILSDQRDELVQALADQQIETGSNYSFVIPQTDPYRMSDTFPRSKRIADTVLTLPIYPQLTNDQVLFVCDAIKKFLS